MRRGMNFNEWYTHHKSMSVWNGVMEIKTPEGLYHFVKSWIESAYEDGRLAGGAEEETEEE
jgi:hypothetical protein